jgi:hypothetical protein
MRGTAIGVKLSVLQLLVEKFALPDGMAVVLYVVYQQRGEGEPAETLDVAADRTIHH